MARYLIPAIVLVLALFTKCVHAQNSADSIAEHLLRTTDEPTVDVESIFDEAEALATNISFDSRARYIADPDAYDDAGYLNNQFLGSPAATLGRIQVAYGAVGGGFAGQKDAWEQSLVDDWSGYLELKGPTSIGDIQIEKAVAGSLALTFGSGLVFGSSSSATYLRASAARMPQPIAGIRHSLSPHSQTSLFGATSDLHLGRFSLTPFYSTRHLDARLDSLGVASIYTYLHRTTDEVQNRNALGVTVGGAHLEYADTLLHLGLTLSRTAYDRPLHTQSARIVRGSTLDHAGLNASIDLSSIQLSAEAAGVRADSGFGRAIYTTLAVAPSPRLRLLAIYHRQDTNYFAPLAATAVSSEGDITNSEGYWLGVESRVTDCLDLSAALTMDHKLQAIADPLNAPSFDEFLDLRLTPSTQFSTSLRYRNRTSSALDNILISGRSTTAIDDRSQSNIRLLARYAPISWLTCNLRTEATVVAHSTDPTSESGAYVQINCRLIKDANSVGVNIARFSTSSYDSRLYSYASEVSGIGSMLLFNGSGYFAAVDVHRELLPWLRLEAYAGGYFYDHSRTLGSGVTERSGSRDITAALQLTLVQWP